MEKDRRHSVIHRATCKNMSHSMLHCRIILSIEGLDSYFAKLYTMFFLEAFIIPYFVSCSIDLNASTAVLEVTRWHQTCICKKTFALHRHCLSLSDAQPVTMVENINIQHALHKKRAYLNCHKGRCSNAHGSIKTYRT